MNTYQQPRIEREQRFLLSLARAAAL